MTENTIEKGHLHPVAMSSQCKMPTFSPDKREKVSEKTVLKEKHSPLFHELKAKVQKNLKDDPIDHLHLPTIQKMLELELEKNPQLMSFFLVNLSTILKKVVEWRENLPRVDLYFAIKANPDIEVLKALVACGAGFDCASINEIETVLGVGASPDRIIFANPVKSLGALAFAKEKGAKLMTFDTAEELRKIKKVFPEAKVVLRILGDDSHSKEPFGSKFGCRIPEESDQLIKLARELDLDLVGLSFHIGSDANSPEGYENTIKMAKDVFAKAKEFNYDLKLLDIGGGWPGTDNEEVSFPTFAKAVGKALEEHFPGDHVRVIAEPGRYIVTEAFTLAVSVDGIRERWMDEDGKKTKVYQYFMSDGVYGVFSNIIFDHQKPIAEILHNVDHKADELEQSTLFGPTCDSSDMIQKKIMLPRLEVGSWLYFTNMGAYTLSSASSFNGFKPPKCIYAFH